MFGGVAISGLAVLWPRLRLEGLAMVRLAKLRTLRALFLLQPKCMARRLVP